MTYAMKHSQLSTTPRRRSTLSTLLTGVAAATIGLGLSLVATPSPAQAATSYYVATTGADTSAGTLAAPFRTIQKCATVAVAGDTCLIRSGTYRETVTPAASGTSGAPITFAPYNGESVVVSGADLVTGWTQYSGNIYKAAVTLPVANETSDNRSTNVATAGALAANQLFVSGKMALEARWPNGTTDPSYPVTATADAGTVEQTIVDSDLPSGVDFTGAVQHQVNPRGWTATTGYVTATGSGNITVQRYSCGGNCAGEGSRYYLTGGTNGLPLLDSAGEWWYDGVNHQLYLWAPAGGNPSSYTVEYKNRLNAFDLSGKSWVNILGLGVLGATIVTDTTSTHDTIDGIVAKYLSHALTVSWDPADPTCLVWCSHTSDTGIQLYGSYNTVKNSDLDYSAGTLISSSGTNLTISNNLLRDGAYLGSYASSVKINANAQATVTNNTIYNSGRFGLDISGAGVTVPSHIAYNNVYNYGIQTRDLGGIYTVAGSGAGSRIDHNWVHDGLTPDKFETSIFLDDSAHNWQVDHNVIWNTGTYGVKLNASGGNGTAFNNLWYNNTIAPGYKYSDGGTTTDATGTTFTNNVWSQGSREHEKTPPNATLVTNMATTTRAQFVNTSVNDYRLQSTSPGINSGTIVAGVTDGYAGTAPDQGAYESGAADWLAGCDLTACAATTTPYLGVKGTSYSSQSGTTIENSSAGGRDVANINTGNWVAYSGLTLSQGAATLTLQVASPRTTPGQIEARVGSATGTLVATCTVPNTGNWQVWTTVTCPVSGLSAGTQQIVLVAKNTADAGTLFNIGSLRFGTAPVTTFDPRVQTEAEQYDAQAGTAIEVSSGSIGDVATISNNDYTRYNGAAFGSTSPSTVTVQVASTSSDTTKVVEFRLGSTAGTLIATCSVPLTGGWQIWVTVTCPVAATTGTQDLFLVYKGGAGNLMNVDWFKFS